MPVNETSYPDFVGETGQQNTPPGGHKTVHAWVDDACVDAESLVLDLACTTGFSGREVHADTGARVHGIDISEPAIEMARRLARGNAQLSYQVADAASLPLPDASFTHVLGGCNFGFIHKRESARSEVARVLRPGGLLCVSSFYYVSPPPEELLARVGRAIGFTPDSKRDHDYWHAFFGVDFELVSERRSQLKAQRPGSLRRAVSRSIRTSPGLADRSRAERDAARDRLLDIRMVLNEHRTYQGLSIAVWRRRDR